MVSQAYMFWFSFIWKRFAFCGDVIFKKRKLDQTNKDKAVVCNKKCQINRTADNKVSNFCQTDPVKLPPEIENILTSEEDDEEKLIRLLAHEDVPREQIELLMHRTFEKRRNFITIKSPLVAAVREQYPALFCVEEVKNELERIFYPGKCKEFLDNMNIYTRNILHYKGSKIDDILEMIEKAHSQSHTHKQKLYAVVGSIFILARHLDENFGFIHLADHPHSSGDVLPHINASPYSLQQIFFDDIFFHIKVEGQHLCEASNFPEAVLCLMATFFIFNMDYPESCRCALTVIEKVYLKGYEMSVMDDKTQQWIKYLTMKEVKKFGK